MGIVVTVTMLLGLLALTKQHWPSVPYLPTHPKFQHNIALLLITFGLWNSLWYGLRHLNTFWGHAAIISGIFMLLAAWLICKIEKEHKDSDAPTRYKARQEQAKPVIDKLKAWKDEIMPKVPPKTALGTALHYLNSQWSRLIGYLNDGRYPIDNNPVENAIRPFTVGRKNWLFSASVKGVNASANLYSLIETAKANDLEPYRYLKHVFKQIPNAEDFDDIDKLLPSNVKGVL